MPEFSLDISSRQFQISNLKIEMNPSHKSDLWVAASYAAEKSQYRCHPERSEGSALSEATGKKQIPRAKPALGMTVLGFPAAAEAATCAGIEKTML
jgi:hypothetical protein